MGESQPEAPQPAVIVPGNHDAYNGYAVGNQLKRRQRSLENFEAEFDPARYATTCFDDGSCRYLWIKKDDLSIYLCLVDSSYPGDPKAESSGVGQPDRVACGKVL